MEVISRSSVSKTGYTGNYALIQDSMPLEVLRSEPIISEDRHGNKIEKIMLGGRFQYAGRPNANGRIYDRGILEHAVKEIQEDINSRRVLGEFDHPPDAKIHLDKVSHLLTKLWMEGDEVMGEIEILPKTSCGSQLKALIESNVSIGISSRGVGDMELTEHDGEQVYKVMPGYSFITYDVVAEPSVHGSYLTVMESRNVLSRHEGKTYRQKVEGNILDAVKDCFK